MAKRPHRPCRLRKIGQCVRALSSCGARCGGCSRPVRTGNSLAGGKPMAGRNPAQRSNGTGRVSNTGGVVLIPKPQRNLLGTLSYLHLACLRSARNLLLLRFATHAEFRVVQLLQFLAYALISDGFGGGSLTVLDRMDAPGDQPFSRPFSLKRSNAW